MGEPRASPNSPKVAPASSGLTQGGPRTGSEKVRLLAHLARGAFDRAIQKADFCNRRRFLYRRSAVWGTATAHAPFASDISLIPVAEAQPRQPRANSARPGASPS